MSMNKSIFQWTDKHIGNRLGISTAVYQKSLLNAHHIAEIRHAGITRIEISLIPYSFNYQNRSQVAEILGECAKQGIKVVSMHGWVRIPRRFESLEHKESVMKESISAIRFAEEAGASIYVDHFGCSEQTKSVITELLYQTPDFQVKLTTENGKNLRDYTAIIDSVGSDRFGLTVDIGHTQDSDGINPFIRKERARNTLAQCGNRVIHMHLHESFNLEQKADHRPPLHSEGIIEWGEIFAAIKDINYKGEFVFEDGRGEDPEEWVQMTADFPKSFVQLYCKDQVQKG